LPELVGALKYEEVPEREDLVDLFLVETLLLEAFLLEAFLLEALVLPADEVRATGDFFTTLLVPLAFRLDVPALDELLVRLAEVRLLELLFEDFT